MGYQIIKQPDGKFCIFSSISDSIIAIDNTQEELIEYFLEMERYRLKDSISNICNQLNEDGEPYYQFTKTFQDVAEIHFETKQIQDKEYNKRIRELLKLKKEQQ